MFQGSRTEGGNGEGTETKQGIAKRLLGFSLLVHQQGKRESPERHEFFYL
jgi:hypothetical protein